MKISIIVAVSDNGVIGRENALPWKISGDLKRFKEITSGHPVIMGRKTYESIGKLLPNRENIIISRKAGYQVAGAEVFSSLEEALWYCQDRSDEVFIIGGAEIYGATLALADRIYLTQVHQDFEGDTYFPEAGKLAALRFEETAREDHPDGEISFSFVTLDRKRMPKETLT